MEMHIYIKIRQSTRTQKGGLSSSGGTIHAKTVQQHGADAAGPRVCVGTTAVRTPENKRRDRADRAQFPATRIDTTGPRVQTPKKNHEGRSLAPCTVHSAMSRPLSGPSYSKSPALGVGGVGGRCRGGGGGGGWGGGGGRGGRDRSALAGRRLRGLAWEKKKPLPYERADCRRRRRCTRNDGRAPRRRWVETA